MINRLLDFLHPFPYPFLDRVPFLNRVHPGVIGAALGFLIPAVIFGIIWKYTFFE